MTTPRQPTTNYQLNSLINLGYVALCHSLIPQQLSPILARFPEDIEQDGKSCAPQARHAIIGRSKPESHQAAVTRTSVGEATVNQAYE
jgi:hypothetical protein